MKRLIIAEKPSMGRDIASALGLKNKQNGYIEGEQYIVTWCIGHLVELDGPESYDEKYKNWRIEDLPIIPTQFKYKVGEQTKAQFNIIKRLLNRSDVTSLVCATDCAREGQLIFDLVYKLCGCKKPVERLWISSLTKEAILTGFRNLKPNSEYAALCNSAHARQRADWLVGMNGTRAQTVMARTSGHSGLFSLGRVQTPTLALIVARDEEIANFKPVTFHEVIAQFQAAGGQYPGKWFNKDGCRISDKVTAQAIARKVQGKPGIIAKVEKKSAREKAPLLYDLTALQRAANVRYAYSADKTLQLAQSLYEKKELVVSFFKSHKTLLS